MVCLFWFITFLAQVRKSDEPKRFFMVYLLACVVLYLCHALFFTVGLSHKMECLWTLCSLSVYPLFYGYLCRLTTADYTMLRLLPWLVPGGVVALAKYLFPEAGFDKVRLFLFACQIVAVCYFGIRKLNAFDRELQSVYADMEGRETTDVHHLLVAIIIVSVLSGVANSIGKHYFGESLWLLIPISMAFSVMLFSLSYICFCRSFTVDQYNLDVEGDGNEKFTMSAEDMEIIGGKVEELMVKQLYFKNKDLKINEIAKEIGSNRTYVSYYVNTVYNCSFSAYMNKMRVEYAKKLLLSKTKGRKISKIAEESGFASEQSFYRNFKKFVGMTPSDWLAMNEIETD